MLKWQYSHSTESPASASQVWAKYQDVADWPAWDDQIEWAQLDGPFTAGAVGQLKPQGLKPSPLQFTHVSENTRFTTLTRLPGTDLVFDHTLIPTLNGVRITHTVRASGILAPVLYFTLRKSLVQHLPGALEALSEQAMQCECACGR